MTRIRTACASAAFLACLVTADAQAKVSDQEAQQLKTVLTPWGSERAGNSAGTIPAWTGGFATTPSGLQPDSVMPDFFAGDARIVTIDAANVDQYADKLPAGAVFMLKNYKGYHIEVYPTHRTAMAPQWYYERTFYNATHAALKGDWLDNIVGGIPFPIPKTGKEIAWNINLTFKGTQTEQHAAFYIVPPNGNPQEESETSQYYWYPYNDPAQTVAGFGGYYHLTRVDTVGPPYRVGEATLSWLTTDKPQHDLEIWQYLVGQRRLRKAPQILYDGTYPDCGGLVAVDELGIWLGAPDRYNFTIVGKKEMYIPYNSNKIYHDTTRSLLGPMYLNPDDVRWELHRVWIVDLDLAPGKRHLIPHRRIYVDEDTWTPFVGDDYDAQGKLWKVSYAFDYVAPFIPTAAVNSQVTYDVKSGGYCAANMVVSDRPAQRPLLPVAVHKSPSFWSPATLAAEAVR